MKIKCILHCIKIVPELNKIYNDAYNYEIWDKDNRNDVYVNYKNKLDKYKFYESNNNLILKKVD